MNAPEPRAAYKVERQRYLGGSDAAAVLGVSPWHTPLDLYLIKTGQKVEAFDPQREKLFRRGKRLEPVVIDMLIEELGLKVTKRSTPDEPNRYADPLEPYLAAEIDFEWEVTAAVADRYDLPSDLIGTVQNGEVKTVHPFAANDAFGEAETDEIPVEYAAQAMHGLMVTGRQLTLFGVLVGADNLIPYFIRRDEETIAGMRAKELDFWHKHVAARMPPDPVNLADVVSLFRRAPASRTTATPDIVEKIGKLLFARNTRLQAEALEDDLKFEIGAFMLGEAGVLKQKDGSARPAEDVKEGVHELLVAGTKVFEVCARTSSRVDAAALREKFPEAAAACTRASRYFVFQSPRRKGK